MHILLVHRGEHGVVLVEARRPLLLFLSLLFAHHGLLLKVKRPLDAAQLGFEQVDSPSFLDCVEIRSLFWCELLAF